MSYLQNSGSISQISCFQTIVSYFCWFHRLEVRLNKLPFNSTQLSVITLCKQTWLNLFSFPKGVKGEYFWQKDCSFSLCCKPVLYWKSCGIIYRKYCCASLQTLYITCLRPSLPLALSEPDHIFNMHPCSTLVWMSVPLQLQYLPKCVHFCLYSFSHSIFFCFKEGS